MRCAFLQNSGFAAHDRPETTQISFSADELGLGSMTLPFEFRITSLIAKHERLGDH